MDFKQLPDVASETPPKAQAHYSSLAWVGMDRIQMPIRWEGQLLSAEVLAQVNLKAGASRGIHMSRLYSSLAETLPTSDLSWLVLENLAQEFVKSQGGISSESRLIIRFQLPMQRRALKSELQGWRLYPVELKVQASNSQGNSSEAFHFTRSLRSEVLYSSTCPASTALTRELWRHELKNQFADQPHLTFDGLDRWMQEQEGMPGTPHAQRSRAEIEVQLAESNLDFGPEELVEGLESALQTPVQTMVKRVDEQEFARLNGQNTMFCEDAARRVQAWLETLTFIRHYRATFEHQESLHPHNAISTLEK